MIEYIQIPDTPAGPELVHKFKMLHKAVFLLPQSEHRVLSAVFDYTGFIDRETVALTVTDLERLTGLSRPTVSVAAQELVCKGILVRTKEHHKAPFVYRIDYDVLDAMGNTVH